jgi:hypothetical protein
MVWLPGINVCRCNFNFCNWLVVLHINWYQKGNMEAYKPLEDDALVVKQSIPLTLVMCS